MLEVLDDIARLIDGSDLMRRLWDDMQLMWTARDGVRDETLIVDALGYLDDYDEFYTLCCNDSEGYLKDEGSPYEFLLGRQQARDEEAGRLCFVVMRREWVSHDGEPVGYGEFVEVCKCDGDLLVKHGSARFQAEPDDPCDVPAVGTELRVAAILKGSHGAA